MSDLMKRLQDFDNDYEKAPAEGAKVDLPPGNYEMRVSKGEVFESKDGRLYLRLDLTVAVGDMAGACVSKLYSIDNPERLPWLKKDMFTMGVMVQKLSELPAQIEKIHDQWISVEVKQNGKFTNYYINRKSAPPSTSDANVPF